MTKEQEQKVVEIYGRDYQEIDIPTYIRKSEADQSKADGLRQEQN